MQIAVPPILQSLVYHIDLLTTQKQTLHFFTIRIWKKKGTEPAKKKEKGVKKKKSSRRPVPTSNTAPVHRATGNFSPPPPRWAEELPPEPSRGGLHSTTRAAVAVGTPQDKTAQLTAASYAY